MLKTATPKTIRGAAELSAAVGEELGISPWYEVSQDRISAFAGATGDQYWIHVDPKRAEAEGMGATIVHGLFTLSLGPQLMDTIVRFEGFEGKLNYGYDRVRFRHPYQSTAGCGCGCSCSPSPRRLDRYGRRWSRRSTVSTKQSRSASPPASCDLRPADG
jgi:hypothetical protein